HFEHHPKEYRWTRQWRTKEPLSLSQEGAALRLALRDKESPWREQLLRQDRQDIKAPRRHHLLQRNELPPLREKGKKKNLIVRMKRHLPQLSTIRSIR